VDLVALLRAKIDTLPQGDYTAGLRAVLIHIERAYKHLTSGQTQDDPQAFTDAIYRTNQAFEGSIKEAYRVLAGKNPEKKKPFEIEAYLDENSVFKPRVLAQFTTYRKEWRNPSTHDYTLSFDQSEAFLAISSVCAFACVLIDQISERIAFLQTRQDADSQPPKKLPDDDEPAALAEILLVYFALFNEITLTLPINDEAQLRGSILGFLSKVAPRLAVTAEAELQKGRPEKADLLVAYRDEKVLVELKRSNMQGTCYQGWMHLEHMMALTGIEQSVLFMYSPGAGKLKTFQRRFLKGLIYLLVPLAEPEPKSDTSGEAQQSTAPKGDDLR
jgi:hypothetical protein